MKDAASRKEFDVVLFWSLGRFRRDGVLETLHHLQKLSRYCVDWFSYWEEYPFSISCAMAAPRLALARVAAEAAL